MEKHSLFRILKPFVMAKDSMGYIIEEYTTDNVYSTENTPLKHIEAMKLREIFAPLSEDESRDFLRKLIIADKAETQDVTVEAKEDKFKFNHKGRKR